MVTSKKQQKKGLNKVNLGKLLVGVGLLVYSMTLVEPEALSKNLLNVLAWGYMSLWALHGIMRIYPLEAKK